MILSEIFPNRIRGKAISVATVCIWLTSAAVAQLFPMMREVMHTGYIFFFFAIDLAALLVVIKFLMPETKGRTIEEIERGWSYHLTTLTQSTNCPCFSIADQRHYGLRKSFPPSRYPGKFWCQSYQEVPPERAQSSNLR